MVEFDSAIYMSSIELEFRPRTIFIVPKGNKFQIEYFRPKEVKFWQFFFCKILFVTNEKNGKR